MLILEEGLAPFLAEGERVDGMIQTSDGPRPGAVLRLWLEARKNVGVVQAKAKQGVKFKVRSNEDLVDKLWAESNRLGLLIYPAAAVMDPTGTFLVFKSEGRLHRIEDGTLAETNQAFIIQAVEDGSKLAVFGYGLGADNQDKAGGKAGTYSMKQALIQALLAGGTGSAKALGVHDTDDTDTPIRGGVRRPADSLAKMRKALGEVTTEDEYAELRPALMKLTPEDQNKLRDDILAAKARAGIGK